MESILHFLSERIGAWKTMAASPKMLWVAAFLVLLLAVDIARRGWRLSWSRRAVQGVFATIAIFHINFILLPLVWLAAVGVEGFYQRVGFPAVPTDFWSGVPLWLLAFIAVFSHDLADYWNHRLLHTRWFWPVHAIHHSDPDVNGLTAYRIHILEALVMWSSYTILLTWLGLPADAIGIGAILISLHVVYVHIDVDWHHGPFRLLLASPRFHRWHHADVAEAYGKNLANIFPIFDWMFGTYRVPGPCNAPLGAAGVPQNDVARLMAWPMTEWLKLAGEDIAALRSRLVAWKRKTGAPQRKTLAAADPIAGPNAGV